MTGDIVEDGQDEKRLLTEAACRLMHPWEPDSCARGTAVFARAALRHSIPMYLSLHLVATAAKMRNPRQVLSSPATRLPGMLAELGEATIRSSLFLSTLAGTIIASSCTLRNALGRYYHATIGIAPGAAASLALLLESPKRRHAFAMYAFNVAIRIIYRKLSFAGILPPIPQGGRLLALGSVFTLLQAETQRWRHRPTMELTLLQAVIFPEKKTGEGEHEREGMVAEDGDLQGGDGGPLEDDDKDVHSTNARRGIHTATRVPLADAFDKAASPRVRAFLQCINQYLSRTERWRALIEWWPPDPRSSPPPYQESSLAREERNVGHGGAEQNDHCIQTPSSSSDPSPYDASSQPPAAELSHTREACVGRRCVGRKSLIESLVVAGLYGASLTMAATILPMLLRLILRKKKFLPSRNVRFVLLTTPVFGRLAKHLLNRLFKQTLSASTRASLSNFVVACWLSGAFNVGIAHHVFGRATETLMRSQTLFQPNIPRKHLDLAWFGFAAMVIVHFTVTEPRCLPPSYYRFLDRVTSGMFSRFDRTVLKRLGYHTAIPPSHQTRT